MNKLVRESITLNEKFTSDDSDPISDMGIGGYSFDTLRPGAVIRSKADLSISQGNTGRFTYYHKGIDCPTGTPLIVTGVRNYVIKGSKEIKLYKLSRRSTNAELEEAIEEARQGLKNDRLWGKWGIKTRLILSKTQFNNKFEVTEKGF